jgi:hypothetical protein
MIVAKEMSTFCHPKPIRSVRLQRVDEIVIAELQRVRRVPKHYLPSGSSLPYGARDKLEEPRCSIRVRALACGWVSGGVALWMKRGRRKWPRLIARGHDRSLPLGYVTCRGYEKRPTA